MKKLVGAMASILAVTMFSGCGILKLFQEEQTFKEKVAEKLSLDFSEATVVEEWDTHGGFHGDGEAFLKMTVADGFEINFDRDGKESAWKTYPLHEEHEVYKYYYEWGGVFENPNVPGMKIIPEITNGYWWYEAETTGFNWNFAALDTDTDTFYYYEFDS